MPTRIIDTTYDRSESLRIPRDGVLTHPDWAPAGAILAITQRRWSQIGLGLSNGLLEVVVRHSHETRALNIAVFDLVGAQRLVYSLARLLSVNLIGEFSEGVTTTVRHEVSRDEWSELIIRRYPPRSRLPDEEKQEVISFVVKHSEDPHAINGAAVPPGHAERILTLIRGLVAEMVPSPSGSTYVVAA
jgi:hypothetical protein